MSDKQKITDKDLYILAVLAYKEKHPGLDDKDLFSVEWNLSNFYRLKTVIIAKAIQENKRVEETEMYRKALKK